MDKIKVNNQVVVMRKHVKRAKLFAINKFTKQMKQLQNKKGSDSQIEKNQRKVERLLEKIKILKQMKPDFVSKKALSKAQDWNSVLTQKNIPLEDQCLALLASDSLVQKEVEKFHSEESQLVEKIPLLFQVWETKCQEKEQEGRTDKKMKASDIRKQKLDKIAKRKKNNFKNTAFSNNGMEKGAKKRKLSNRDTIHPEPDDDAHLTERNAVHLEPDDDDTNSQNDDSESKRVILNDNHSLKSESDGESSNDSNGDVSGAEGFFTRLKEDHHNEENTKSHCNSKKVINPPKGKKDTKSSVAKQSAKQSVSVKREVDTIPQSTIFDRLNSIANKDHIKANAKQRLSKVAAQKNKAIAVLDLNDLQDSEKIPIKNISTDLEDLPSQPVVAKKDSFFLNGDEDPSSGSDEEQQTNRDRHFKPGRKFQKFDNKDRNQKFKRNGFNDKISKSSKDNYKGNKYNTSENRFRKQFNKNSEFNSEKRFGKNPKNNTQKFKNFNQASMNNSFNLKKENRKNASDSNYKPNKQMTEKGEENKNLHPSWEAKKKAKLAEKSGFQGKRMVFD